MNRPSQAEPARYIAHVQCCLGSLRNIEHSRNAGAKNPTSIDGVDLLFHDWNCVLVVLPAELLPT